MCGILILANILRIGFWFAKGFATNLLVQSFIIIIFQLVILHLCVRLGYKKKEDIHMQGLWRWNTFPPFRTFPLILVWTVLSLGTAVALLTTFMIYMKVHNYGDVLGMISLSIEAMVGIPQLITNQTNRSVEGLSVFMIITWFLGDFLKTLYFIVEVHVTYITATTFSVRSLGLCSAYCWCAGDYSDHCFQGWSNKLSERDKGWSWSPT